MPPRPRARHNAHVVRVVRLICTALCAILTGALTATSAAAAPTAQPAPPITVPVVAPVPTPAVPAGLPVGIEGLARYVPATSCDAKARAGTTRLGKLLTATYPGTSFGTDRACGADVLPTSEHYDGRALDWMIPSRDPTGAARAAAVLSWLFAPDAAGNPFANARRLGVMYIIWNNQIWGAYNSAAGWRPYSSCASRPDIGSDTACHRDHVHFSMSWEGATGHTSFWTGTVAAPDFGPCRAPDLNWAIPYSQPNPLACLAYPRLVAPAGAPALTRSLVAFSGMWLTTGSVGPAVTTVQQALLLPADGVFGAATRGAVTAFQQAHQIPASGRVDADTWRALLAANNAIPLAAAPPVVARPAVFPPVLTVKPVMLAKPVVTPRRAGPLTRYRSTVLRRGSHGAAVKALQKALRVTPRNGAFGARTRAAVIRFQRTHRLPATGVVARRTWQALGA